MRVRLDWSTANVEHGELTVDLEGEIPSGWKGSFETTAKLLASNSEWGAVSVSEKGRTVSVSDVTEGVEERLHALLEGAVEQANANHPPSEPDADEDDHEDDGEDDAGDDAGPDSDMTERFRSFGD
jgi:hypothetical protein